MSTTYYAIGDVHGEAERLALLHEAIRRDIELHGVRAAVVHLGDYVDRGSDSRGAIEAVMRFEASAPCRTISLLGNHEQMMLRAYDRFDSMADHLWAVNGGAETIHSYRVANGGDLDWRDSVDKRHIKWLRALETMWRDEERKIAFVHAGIDPRTFPNCEDEIRVWTRNQRFFESWGWPKRPELDGWMVVHGHTPTQDMAPHVQARRVNVDTGAVFGGPLTCAVLTPGAEPRFLQT